MNIVISACPMGMEGSGATPRHRRQLMTPGNLEIGGERRDEIVVKRYLAKICHSDVALAEQSQYPALRCEIDVRAIPMCCHFHCQGLRWCVRLLRCRKSIRCSVA